MSCDIIDIGVGIPQGELLINTLQIEALAYQIRHMGSCAALQQVIEQAIASVTSLLAGIIKTQADILADFFPILNLPGPNPFAIVKWIAKLVFGTALTQYLAYIQYVLQLIQLAAALQDLVNAIEEAIQNLSDCSISFNPSISLTFNLAALECTIAEALINAGNKHTALQQVAGAVVTLPTFNTTNSSAFKASVNTNLASFKQQANTFINSSVTPAITPTTGQVLTANSTGGFDWADPAVVSTLYSLFTVSANASTLTSSFGGGNTFIRLTGNTSSYSEPAMEFGEQTLTATAKIASKNEGNGGGSLYFLTRDTSATNSVLTTQLRISGTGDATFSNTISGNGSGITSVSATNISTGTVNAARLGSGTANSTTVLYGNNTWATVSSVSGLVAVNVYTTSVTVTIPTGATKANIEIWGGGGGSGSADGTNPFPATSGGGGGAGWLRKYLSGLTPGNTLQYTQGAAGTGGTSGGNGGTGGSSILASNTQTITTLTANGGAGSTASGGSGASGRGATNGDLNITGSSGQSSISESAPCGVGKIYSIGVGGISGGGVRGKGGDGVGTAATSSGNAGYAGGMIIEWFA